MSQPQRSATISTGGAAKGVSVPPIEMLTNSTPSVAYMKCCGALAAEIALAQQQRGERHRRRLGDEGAEQRADRQEREVVGMRPRQRQQRATRASAAPAAKSMTGRLAAITMIDEHEGGLGEVAAFEVVAARLRCRAAPP